MAFSATEDGLTFNWLEQFKNRGKQELFSGRLSEDKFAETMGEYDKAVKATDGSLDLFNKTQTKAKNGVAEYTGQLNGASHTYADYNSYLDQANEAQNKQISIGQKLKGFGSNIAAGLGNALVGGAISAVAGLAINGVITLIDDWVHRSENLIKAGQEAKQEIDSLNSEYNSHKDTVQNVVDTYDDLRSKVDQTTNENKGLSSSQYEEFLNQNNELASMFPSLVSGYDSQGNAIINLGNSATIAKSQLEGLLEVERESANYKISDKAQDQYKGTAEEVKGIEKEIRDLQRAADDKEKLAENLSSSNLLSGLDDHYLEIDPSQKGSQEAIKALREAMVDAGVAFEENITSIGTDADGNPIARSIFSIFEMTDAQKQDIVSQVDEDVKDVIFESQDTANQSLKEIKFKENEIAAKWAELAPTVSAMLQSSPNFNGLDTTLQDGITNMIPNFDYSIIQSKFGGDIESFVKNGILAPIATATPEVQNAYKELFTLEEDSSDMAIKDWAAKRDGLIKEITGGDKEQTNDLLQNLGYLDSNGKGKIRQQLDLVEDSLDKAEGVRSTLRGMTRDDLEIAYDIIINDDDNAIETLDQLNAAIKNRKDEIDAEEFSLESMTSHYEKAIEYQDSLNAAMASSVSAKGLSSDDISNINTMFTDIEGYDDKTKAVLFEKTANGVHLNSKALRELQTAQEATTKAGFLKSREKILDQLKQEQDQLKTLTKDTDEYNEAQNNISGLKTDLSNLDLLAAQYDGLTSAYQKWVNAQSNGEEGDMYDSFQTAIDRGKELYKEGLVGTNEFRAITDLFTYGDQSNASVDELVSAYKNASPTIKKFFTEGADGASKFLDTMSKTTDETGKAFAEWKTVTDENGNEKSFWKFNAGDDDNLAQQLGIDVEAVQAIMRKLKNYGFDVQIGDTTGIDSYTDGLEELETKAAEAKERLSQMESSEVFDSTALKSALDFDVDSLSIDQLKDKISEINDTRPSLDVDSESYNDAQAVIDGCQARIDEINDTTAILTYNVEGADSVDDLETKKSQLEDYQATLDVDSSRYEETSALIDQIQGKIDTLNVSSGATTSVGANFDELNNGYQKVQELQSALQELSSVHVNPTVTADGIADAEAKVQSAAQAIATLPSEVRIQMGITGETPEEIANQLMTEEVEIPVIFQQEGNKSDLDLDSEEKQISVSANVEKGEIDSLSSTLASLPSDTPITVTLTAIGEEQIQTLKSAIESLSDKNIGITATVSGTDGITALKSAQDTVEDKNVTTESQVTGTELVNALTAAIARVNSKSVTVSASVNGTDAVRALANSISAVHSKTVTVTSITNNITNNTSQATGTMLSSAHANGTAYNVLNYKNAYANGDVSIPRDETALVNEMGTESIIRNGIWSLIPGGMHMQALKKGDIVLNASQTDSLLKHGKAAGTGKAYADGTVGNIRNLVSTSLSAYSAGSGKFYGGAASNNGKSASSSNKSNNNTAKAASSAAQSAADAAEKTAELFDHIERHLENLSNTTDRYLKYAEGANTLNGSLVNYQSAINNIFKELSANQSAHDRYMAQANTVQLDEGMKALIRNGAIDIREYDEDTQKKIDDYQKWFEAAEKCSEALIDLRQQQKKLAKEKLDKIVDHYNLRSDLYQNKVSYGDAHLDYRKQMGYIEHSSPQKKVYTNQLNAEKSNLKNLSGAYAKYKSELDLQVKNGLIKKNSPVWYEAQQQLQEYNEAIYKSKTAIEEFREQIRTLNFTKLQYAVDKAARWIEKLDSILTLKEARGKTVTESDYKKQVSANNSEIAKLYEQKKAYAKEQKRYSVNSEKYQELAESIAKCDEEILNLLVDNEELKDSIRAVRWKPFEDGQAKISFVIDEIDNLINMQKPDSFIDDDTGEITTEGYANLALISKGMEAHNQKIADYRTALEKLDKELKNGNISQDEYNEKSREYIEIIQNSVNSIDDYKDAITDLYITQQEKQNELLQDEISLRKKALDKKKQYYDYDKKISSKNKDINSLKSQIAALEGVNSAAGRAELARLKDQLAEAEEEKKDLVTEHEYDIRSDSYDQLSEDANDALEKVTKAVQSNADVIQQVTTDMLGGLVDNYKDAFSEIEKLVTDSGLVISDSLSTSLAGLNNASKTGTTVDNALANPNDTNASKSATNINTDKIVTGNSTNTAAEKSASTKESTTNRPVVSISLDKSSVTIKVGKTATVKVKSYLPSDAKTNFKWKTSNSKVATVSGGKVKGVKSGSVTITCYDGTSGAKATCSVKVEKASSTMSAKTKYYSSASTSGSSLGTIASGSKVSIAQTTTDSKNATWYKVTSGDKTGWVKSSSVKKYAKGTLCSNDELAEINELGKELVFRYDGHDYTNLSYGSKVLTAKQTDSLIALSNLKGADIINNLVPASNSSSTSINMQPTSITIHYDALLHVDGNVDRNALPELKTILKQSYAYTTKELKKEAGKLGLKK